MRKQRWAYVLLLVALSGAALAAVAPGGGLQQSSLRPYRLPLLPNCGGPQTVPPPGPDASGNSLYFRMVDSAGYDFEVWCMTGFSSLYYEYRMSFPDGTSTPIDVCELFMGNNVVVLGIEGDSVVNDTTPNGAPLHRLRGRIRRYYHNNFNSSKDFHTVLDYGTGAVRRFDTRLVQGEDGQPFREITGTSEWTLEIPRQSAPATPGSSIAPVHGGTIVRSVAADPSIPFCASEQSDSLAIVEWFLPDDADGAAVYYLASAGIEAIRAGENEVEALLDGSRPARGMSLVVPREVGGVDGLARVTVDGADVPNAQSLSGSLRTVTFVVPERGGSVRIEASPERTSDRRLWLVAVLLLLLFAWFAGRRSALAHKP